MKHKDIVIKTGVNIGNISRIVEEEYNKKIGLDIKKEHIGSRSVFSKEHLVYIFEILNDHKNDKLNIRQRKFLIIKKFPELKDISN